MFWCKLISVFLLLIFTGFVELNKNASKKILLISMPAADSHRRSLYPLARELGRQGHNVTILMEGISGTTKQPSASESEFIRNLILLGDLPGFAEETESVLQFITWINPHTSPVTLAIPWSMYTKVSWEVWRQNPEAIRNLITEKWDLVLVDVYFATGPMSLAMLTGRQYGSFLPCAISATQARQAQVPRPSSYVATLFLPNTQYRHESFWSRLESFSTDLIEFVSESLIDHFIVQQNFSTLLPQLSFGEFSRRQKFSIENFPAILEPARPTTFNVLKIDNGCPKTATSLEAGLKQFIEDPRSKGTIIVAFGHMVKWKLAPGHVTSSFAQALNNFTDYRVIWQFNDDASKYKLGKHIRVMSWLPQIALLNHPKTKLFISHGGLKSISETLCAKVPALVIPFFAEQIRNSFLFETQGIGVSLSKFDLTTRNLTKSINTVLSDRKFYQRITKLNSFQTDRIKASLDLGVFWTEFFIRHENVSEKRFKIKNECWIQFLMLDVLAVSFGIFFGFLFLITLVLNFILKPRT